MCAFWLSLPTTICESLVASLLRLRLQLSLIGIAIALLLCSTGCGTTKQNMATEQMLNSDAVDAAVAKIDFTPLAGEKVFFDTKYMTNYKGVGFVTAEYVISALRQQMSAAGILIQNDQEAATYVLEGRIGVLGTDAHEVVYGIPSNSPLNSAAQVAAATTTGAPIPASIPELSLARRNDQAASAKIGLFAYEKGTKEVVWQSGSSVAKATAKDLWVMGIGPFQKGSIYKGKVRFAGEANDSPIPPTREGYNGPIVAYAEERIFKKPIPETPPEVLQASGAEANATKQPETAATPEKPASAPPEVPPSAPPTPPLPPIIQSGHSVRTPN
ncbi:DUF6655 family protein [Planctomicrobium sp. SH527]|uniref:DUF6655 family protein n=1 Tax=Planctomicrobium sp. SH527 TaxID=3448123 RepID=UPI003F5B4101